MNWDDTLLCDCVIYHRTQVALSRSPSRQFYDRVPSRMRWLLQFYMPIISQVEYGNNNTKAVQEHPRTKFICVSIV